MLGAGTKSASKPHRSRFGVRLIPGKDPFPECVGARREPGLSRRRGKPLGLKTGLELPVCKPPGAGASPDQDSKWKFRFADATTFPSCPRAPGGTRLAAIS